VLERPDGEDANGDNDENGMTTEDEQSDLGEDWETRTGSGGASEDDDEGMGTEPAA
jgi:hypothetical protein